MKKFDIPEFYRSPIITKIKEYRKIRDPRKKDYTPTKLDFGPVVFYIARHFGFCYGVENAIEIAYTAIAENPGKRIFLLSEMIHNPLVNEDLKSNGINFIFTSDGIQIIPWENISKEDVIIVPAFGMSLEIEQKLKSLGLMTTTYNTTCPFVEKVWTRAKQLGEQNYTVVVHGKFKHEETTATFSHSKQNAPSVIVRDLDEAKILGNIILGHLPVDEFWKHFADKCSEGFNPENDLLKIGVVNQTTMLSSETEEIANYFKQVMITKFGEENINEHFADTRDTLCYATNDNQRATLGLLQTDASFAVVVGGYNSSNTSHIVELLAGKFPTYFISSDNNIHPDGSVNHFDLKTGKEITTQSFIPNKVPVNIVITSGASCPDSLVDKTILKILSLFRDVKTIEEVMSSFN